MNLKEYWTVLFTQAIYVFLALSVAMILWTYLPEASSASFEGKQWKFSGAFAGFAFVLIYLNRTGLVKEGRRTAFSPVKAGILLTPSEIKKYNSLFDDFADSDFYAFNPPFRLEGDPGENLFEDALKTHEKRYIEGKVKSQYLFYDKSSYERAELFFNKLDERIKGKFEKYPIKKIFWENPPEVPGYTFFIGHKKGNKPYCIFYPTVGMKDGLPQVIIHIEGAEDFLTILLRHFKKNWNQAKINSDKK